MTEVARVEHEEPGFRIATWRNVAILVWRGQVTIPRLDEVLRRERVLKARHPKGIVPFTIVSEVPTELLKMGEAERKRAAEVAQELAGVTIAHPNVVLGSGFWAAAVRGVISASYLLSRASYPNKAFDSIGTACTWVTPLMARGGETAPDARELTTVVESVAAR